jgi:hypothetical protein
VIGGLQIGQMEYIKKDFIEMHCDDNWIKVALDLGTVVFGIGGVHIFLTGRLCSSYRTYCI